MLQLINENDGEPVRLSYCSCFVCFESVVKLNVI